MHAFTCPVSFFVHSWSSLGTKLRASLGTRRAGYISWDPGHDARLLLPTCRVMVHTTSCIITISFFFFSVQTNWERTVQDAGQMDRLILSWQHRCVMWSKAEEIGFGVQYCHVCVSCYESTLLRPDRIVMFVQQGNVFSLADFASQRQFPFGVVQE